MRRWLRRGILLGIFLLLYCRCVPAQEGGYVSPPFRDARFHPESAVGNESVQIDLSMLGEGYVALTAWSPNRLKFQVLLGEYSYTYDLSNDGTANIFPLNLGDGWYTFRVMENVVESKYAILYLTEADVALQDPFQPFLHPSVYSNYSENSACVQKARELAAGADSTVGFITSVYDFICGTVTYDVDKAQSVQSGYLPFPDETMVSGKGICFDYASLAAAMLRSQGVPTMLIFGYVSPDDIYHAWNMFYTAETGWVTVDYQVSGGNWNRLDLTFSANGADGNFIGDGSNYTDMFYY